MLGIVVAVVAVIALRDPRGQVSGAKGSTIVVTTSATAHSSSSRSAPSRSVPSRRSTSVGTTAPRSSVPATGARSVPLIVLNNTTTSGLAGKAAQRLRSGGWTVTRYGNLPGTITNVISTCAYYDPSDSTAKAAAQAVQAQFPSIRRVRAKFAGLPAGPVVIVLTPDYS